MQNALRLGATRAEILEIIELVSVLGIHACNMAVPILHELTRRKKAPASA